MPIRDSLRIDDVELRYDELTESSFTSSGLRITYTKGPYLVIGTARAVISAAGSPTWEFISCIEGREVFEKEAGVSTTNPDIFAALEIAEKIDRNLWHLNQSESEFTLFNYASGFTEATVPKPTHAVILVATGQREDTDQSLLYGGGSIPVPVLDAPTNLTVSPLGSDSALFSWDAVPGATDYRLYIDDGANGDFQLRDDSVTDNSDFETSFTLTPNLNYRAYVVARNASQEEGNFSNVVTFRTTVPLPVPTNLTVDPTQNRSSAELSWDSALNSTGYSIEYKLSSENWGVNSAITIPSTQTTYLFDQVLNEGETYNFRIRAIHGTEFSSYTSEVSVETNSRVFSPTISDGGSTEDSITVDFTQGQNANQVDSLVVALNVSGQTPQVIQESGISIPGGLSLVDYYKANENGSFVLTGLASSQAFDIILRPTNVFGSVDSNTLTASTSSSLGVPGNLSVSNVSSGTSDPIYNILAVSFDAVSGATNYDIEYRLGSSGGFTVQNVNVSGTFQIPTPTAGTWEVRVRAKDDSSNSGDYTNIATGVPNIATAPTAPQNILFQDQGDGNSLISFSAPLSDGDAPIDFYNIFVNASNVGTVQADANPLQFSVSTPAPLTEATVSAVNDAGLESAQGTDTPLSAPVALEISSASIENSNPNRVVVNFNRSYSTLPVLGEFNVANVNNYNEISPQQQTISAGGSASQIYIDLVNAALGNHVPILDMEIDGVTISNYQVQNNISGSSNKRILPSIPDLDNIVADSGWANLNTTQDYSNGTDFDSFFDVGNGDNKFTIFNCDGLQPSAANESVIEGEYIYLAGHTAGNGTGLIDINDSVVKVLDDRNADGVAYAVIHNFLFHSNSTAFADMFRAGDNNQHLDFLVFKNCGFFGGDDESLDVYGQKFLIDSCMFYSKPRTDYTGAQGSIGSSKAFGGLTFTPDGSDHTAIIRNCCYIGNRERNPNMRNKHSFHYNNLIVNPQLRMSGVFSPKESLFPNSFSTNAVVTKNLILFGNQTLSFSSGLNIDAEGSNGDIQIYFKDNEIQLQNGSIVPFDDSTSQYIDSSTSSGGTFSFVNSIPSASLANHPGFNPMDVSSIIAYQKRHCGPSPLNRPSKLQEFWDDIENYGSVQTALQTTKYNYYLNHVDSWLGANTPSFNSSASITYNVIADPFLPNGRYPLYSNLDIQLMETGFGQFGKENSLTF